MSEVNRKKEFVEKIIGGTYVMHDGEFFAADIYEGNYYKIKKGSSVITMPLANDLYERVLKQYEEHVAKNERFKSAYEMNKQAHLKFEVPVETADPEAAEKEWYIRTHPQVVETVEEPKKKGIFGGKGKKKKGAVAIKCLKCGAVNDQSQKFCGECGARLASAEEEILDKQEAKPVEKEPEPVEQKTASEIAAQDVVYEDEVIEEPVKEVPKKKTVVKQVVVEERESEITEPKKADKKKKEKKVSKEESSETKPKKKTGVVILIAVLVTALIACLAAAAFLFIVASKKPSGGNINDSALTGQESTVAPEVQETVPEDNAHVVIKLKNNVSINQQITEADIEGVKLTEEQWSKYNNVSSYIDVSGQVREEVLLLWADKDNVVGKYATRELTAGTVLYDTAITTEHVVADKTFVDVEVDGEGNTYEVESNVLPGNTRIQIVAIVQTDGGEPQKILLSEMMLQDRSLQSIFDSAGQDILEMLSGESEGEGTEEAETDAETDAEAETPAE